MKNLKKALCMFLALVMCLGMLPVSAFAAEAEQNQTEITTSEGAPVEGNDPAGENDPAEGKDPAEGNDPAGENDPAEGNDPAGENDPAEGNEPAGENDPADETPAEVKAFLDAVANIPEITPENAEEVAEYVYGEVSEAYEELLGTEYEDRDDVQEAVATYAAAIEAVDAALDMESDDFAGGATLNKTLSEGPVTKYVGETGFYQRLPRWTNMHGNHVASEYIPSKDEYFDDSNVVFDDEELVIGENDIFVGSFAQHVWLGSYDYYGDPCFQVNFKVLKPGIHTFKAQPHYKFNAPAEYGYCGCGALLSIPANYTYYYDDITVTVKGVTDYTVTYTGEGVTTNTQRVGYQIANVSHSFTAASAPADRTVNGKTYTFAGWLYSGNGQTYAAGASVPMTWETTDGRNVQEIMTAQWVEATTYEVVREYVVNSAEYPNGSTIATVRGSTYVGKVGDKITGTTLASKNPSWANYTTDGVKYTYQYKSSNPAELELSATASDNVITLRYERNVYTVTYKDGCNGSVFGDVSQGNLKAGDKTPAFAGSTDRIGYTFQGWSPTVKSTVDPAMANNYVIIYTATWKCNHTNVDYTDNGDGTHDGVCDQCHQTVKDNEKHSDSGNDGFCDKCNACMHNHDKNGYCTNPNCNHKNPDGTQKNCCPKPAPETPELEVKKAILLVKAPDDTIRYDGNPQPGDTIQYQITVTNKGNEAVENVVIIDKLDDNKLTFDSASGRGQSWNSEPDKGRYEVGKLDKVNTQTTSSYVLTINAIVKDNVAPGTTISNTATADCDDMPEGDKPSDSANVTVPNPKLTGFTKVLVRTEAEATAAGVNTEGITFPGNGEVKVPSGQTGVTLLYKITVTGEKGAVYEVGDMMNGKHADVVKGTLFGAFTEDGSVDIYVTMSFTQDDIANGKVTNTATVTPGANTDNKTPGADPTAPTKPSTATDESDANKQYKVTVNFKTEDGTELTTPVVTDPIDDGDDYIFRLTGGSWSTFSLRGTEIPVTVTDENGKTYSLDEVASAAELERLSGTINGKDEVINLIYALDEKGGDDTTKPEGGSDGTPDKYQAKVVYTATNGGTITSETKSEYLTIRDADGQMAAEGTITITGATASANTGNHFVNWTAAATGHDDWNYTPTTAVELGSGDVSAKGNAVYTFTANFEADPEQVTITLTYDANGGSNAPVADSQTVDKGGSATFTVSNGVPTRSNYRFTGWNTIAGGTGMAYSAGGTITTDADVILYAQWEYTGGGSGGNPGGGGTDIPDTNPPTTDSGTDIEDENPPLANVDDKLNTTDHFAYIIGYPEGDVRPNANITRAEAVTIFFRLMTDEFRAANWSSENAYPDVESGDWFNNAISTLTNAGIFKGDETGNARPNDAITRAEFAALAARFMSDEIADDGARFEDTEGHWAAADIRRAMLAGWIKGVGGNKFEPDRNITRAEVMTLVNRMLDRVADKDHMLSDMKTWSDNMDTSAWYYADVQEATNGHDYERLEGELTEQWTALQEARDWAALETEWATAESGK